MTEVLPDARSRAAEPAPTADPVRRRAWWIAIVAWACALAAGWLSGSLVPMICGLLVAALALVDTDPDFVPAHSYGLTGLPDGPPSVLAMSARAHRAAALVGALAILGLSVLKVATAVSIAVLLVVALVTWLRSSPQIAGRRHLKKLRRALVAHAPTVAMPFAGRSGAPWQVGQWEPFLAASDEPGVVLNVHRKYLPMLIDGGLLSTPVVQLGTRGTADLSTVVVPTVRAMFYVQNAATNVDFLATPDVTHVWLGHGDSDKPGSHSHTHHLYDLIVVCGQAGIDRYAAHGVEVPQRQFVVLGRPQTRGIHAASGPIGSIQSPTVLYAPTWHGVDPAAGFSSLEQGPQLVQALVDRGVTVIFRPHPSSYHWRHHREAVQRVRDVLRADRERTGREHQYGAGVDRELSVVDCINRCDALVTDVSAVASDVLASGKPYAMVTPGASIEQFRTERPVAETAYVILGDMTNLEDALDDLLFHDPMALARAQRRGYVLGDLTGSQSAQAFSQFVRAMVGSA